MAREPVRFYRLWCGRKRYSHWLSSLDEIWEIAFTHELAYPNLNGDGGGGLGPLTWIERGTRQYARSRTVPDGRL